MVPEVVCEKKFIELSAAVCELLW